MIENFESKIELAMQRKARKIIVGEVEIKFKQKNVNTGWKILFEVTRT
jgi:hypothetical protein